MSGQYLRHMRFADDMVFFSQTSRRLQNMLRELCSESLVAGLTVNTKTYGYMFIKHAKEGDFNVYEILETVSGYSHIGQGISAADHNHKKGITRKISMVWAAFSRNSAILISKLTLSLKKVIFKQCAVTVMTYWTENWGLSKRLERKLHLPKGYGKKNAKGPTQL